MRQIEEPGESAAFDAALDVLKEGGYVLGLIPMQAVAFTHDPEAEAGDRRAFEIVWNRAVEWARRNPV